MIDVISGLEMLARASGDAGSAVLNLIEDEPESQSLSALDPGITLYLQESFQTSTELEFMNMTHNSQLSAQLEVTGVKTTSGESEILTQNDGPLISISQASWEHHDDALRCQHEAELQTLRNPGVMPPGVDKNQSTEFGIIDDAGHLSDGQGFPFIKLEVASTSVGHVVKSAISDDPSSPDFLIKEITSGYVREQQLGSNVKDVIDLTNERSIEEGHSSNTGCLLQHVVASTSTVERPNIARNEMCIESHLSIVAELEQKNQQLADTNIDRDIELAKIKLELAQDKKKMNLDGKKITDLTSEVNNLKAALKAEEGKNCELERRIQSLIAQKYEAAIKAENVGQDIPVTRVLTDDLQHRHAGITPQGQDGTSDDEVVSNVECKSDLADEAMLQQVVCSSNLDTVEPDDEEEMLNSVTRQAEARRQLIESASDDPEEATVNSMCRNKTDTLLGDDDTDNEEDGRCKVCHAMPTDDSNLKWREGVCIACNSFSQRIQRGQKVTCVQNKVGSCNITRQGHMSGCKSVCAACRLKKYESIMGVSRNNQRDKRCTVAVGQLKQKRSLDEASDSVDLMSTRAKKAKQVQKDKGCTAMAATEQRRRRSSDTAWDKEDSASDRDGSAGNSEDSASDSKDSAGDSDNTASDSEDSLPARANRGKQGNPVYGRCKVCCKRDHRLRYGVCPACHTFFSRTQNGQEVTCDANKVGSCDIKRDKDDHRIVCQACRLKKYRLVMGVSTNSKKDSTVGRRKTNIPSSTCMRQKGLVYKCCGRKFTTAGSLALHLKSVRGKKCYKRLECECCKRPFNNEGNLAIHIKRSHGPKYHMNNQRKNAFCKLAKPSLHTAGLKRSPIKRINASKRTETGEKQSSRKCKIKKVECSECRCMITKNNMKRHIERIHCQDDGTNTREPRLPLRTRPIPTASNTANDMPALAPEDIEASTSSTSRVDSSSSRVYEANVLQLSEDESSHAMKPSTSSSKQHCGSIGNKRIYLAGKVTISGLALKRNKIYDNGYSSDEV